MSEEIGYTEPEKKVVPPLATDATEQEMRAKAIKGIEQSQINTQEKIKAGIQEPPKNIESVPKEVPFIFFKLGSKILHCEKFQTDDEENKVCAKHLSILIGAHNTKMWSLIVILLVIIGKVTACFDRISQVIHRKKEGNVEKKNENRKRRMSMTYELKQYRIVVNGIPTEIYIDALSSASAISQLKLAYLNRIRPHTMIQAVEQIQLVEKHEEIYNANRP